MNTEIIFCNIQTNSITKLWQIKITDDDDKVINICQNIDEFYKAMKELNERNLLEVHWSKDNDVSDEHFNEIKLHMDSFQYEIKDKKE